MGVVAAQELERVGREVDDQQAAAGGEQLGGLADCAGGIVEEVQHLVDDDEVERVALERRAVDVALPEVDAADLGPLEVGARDGEHRVAAVEADARSTRSSSPASNWSMRPVPVPRSSDRAMGRVAEHVEDRRLDHLVRRMQRALLVPAGGDAGEVLLCSGSTPAADDRKPVEVGRQHGVVRVGAGEHVGHELTDGAVDGEVEERPRALAMLVDDAGIGEQLEVAGDSRLRLAEDVGQVGDRELAVLEQGDDPQSRVLADRPQDEQCRVGGEPHLATI